MNKNLTWSHLKALNTLYVEGRTRANIQSHPYIEHLIKDKSTLAPKFGNKKILEASDGFNEFYESTFFQSFKKYQEFFALYDFLTPQSRFKERDIRALMLIAEQKEQINETVFSRKKFSSTFFQDSKYLRPESGLEKAVLNILGLEHFQGADPKDQQYRLVIDCKEPKYIVLCENIDFLLYPEMARENNIWLWYVGGNNTSKLDHLPPIDLPIYYSCDWDFDGLRIYQNIKDKISSISILYPNMDKATKPIDSGNHRSDWKYDVPFSGLKKSPYYFNEEAVLLITELIKHHEWIEEESNDLAKMLFINH